MAQPVPAEGGQCISCGIPIFQSFILPQLTHKAELHKIVRSNDFPTHVQASHCQEIISSAPAELDRYEVEILRLRAILDKMEHDRALVDDYLRLCRYTVSPIRRLPSEILTEIFSFFLPAISGGTDPSSTLGTPGLKHEDAVEEELARVANADLLRISQVCPRWHQLIMGTPSLWSVLGLNLHLWHGPSRGRMMAVLQSSLERGGDFPLDLRVQVRGLYGHNALALIPLLALYSRRWKKVTLSVDYASQLRALSSVQGNLPLLETLHIDVQHRVPEFTVVEVTSYFTVAPRLTQLWYCGKPAALCKLPLEQLQLFVYLDVLPPDLEDLFSTMGRLSNTRCNCQIRVRVDNADFQPAIESPPVVSHVSVLELCGADILEPDRAEPLVTKFVTRLTLPFLVSLQLVCHRDQWFPLPWPHLEFQALSHRSSFHSHLKHLRLESVSITEAELFQTLSGLPLLQDLIISDVSEGDEKELVTSSLLQRLTWTPDSTCLVPELSFLECHTVLRFDDTVFRDFVLSRLKPGRNAAGPFEVDLQWYLEYHRELDPEVVAQFAELQSQGELLFSNTESPLFRSSYDYDV
ncbi:F-box domain-containing protein [Mycena venus]|uniref:F-box domain-containing protein n=1 Tax=Mycena venus TaxID=2733690 RepID=A0A8H6YM39_9AGAR|nr:F-box domain-containing protein [Mycena venus]